MSAADETHKSLRYKLGELLRDTSDHILLLTATPHKGDPLNFSLFLQLLDADAYADARSIREAMDRRRAPFYLRRTKEAMVYFPERRSDGTWAAEKIFTKRIPVAELQNRCPNVSVDMIRRILKNVRATNQIECLGRGQNARWQKTAKWQLGNIE